MSPRVVTAANGSANTEPFFFPSCIARSLRVFGLSALAGCVTSANVSDEETIWSRLQSGGHILVIQSGGQTDHAAPSVEHLNLAKECKPGTGLSGSAGKRAERLAQKIRAHGVDVGRVLTSRDCSGIESARIIFGRAELWSILDDSRAQGTQLKQQKFGALHEAVSRWGYDENLVLIAHQRTIREAFDPALNDAHALVIEPLGDNGYRVVGRIAID